MVVLAVHDHGWRGVDRIASVHDRFVVDVFGPRRATAAHGCSENERESCANSLKLSFRRRHETPPVRLPWKQEGCKRNASRSAFESNGEAPLRIQTQGDFVA
jgi:hypothetical protein